MQTLNGNAQLALSLGGGFLLGIAASFVVWWFVTHKLAPRIRFSEKVEKSTSHGTTRYRVRFRNEGKRRIIDVTLRGRVVVPCKDAGHVLIYTIQLQGEHLPASDPLLDYTVTLGPVIDVPQFPALDVTITQDSLESILAANGSYVQLFLFAYDSFSGSRTLVESPRYKASDLLEGSFLGGMLAVHPRIEQDANHKESKTPTEAPPV